MDSFHNNELIYQEDNGEETDNSASPKSNDDSDSSSENEYDNEMEGGGGDFNNNDEEDIDIIPDQDEEYNSDSDDGEEINIDDDIENDDEFKFQKFNNNLDKNYLLNYHPECIIENYEEVLLSSIITRDNDNNIIDDLHRTIPLLSKFEKAKILGIRALQINSGSKPFINIPENIIDGYIIAEMELKAKKLPYIIKRPIGNKCEFWKVSDLENINY